MHTFIKTLPHNLVRCFWGTNIFYHIAAIVLTYIIIISGGDWAYWQATHDSFLFPYLFPAAIIGFFVPVFLPIALYFAGAIFRREDIRAGAYAVAQSVIIASVVAALYKAFTGRVHPDLFATGPQVDISHQFHFGLLDGGIFWGWPSSHTTVAFALAVTLVMLFPRKRLVQILALLFAAYVGVGVSISIHWLSDAVAGVLFGTMIGIVVGTSYRKYAARTPIA